MDLIDQASLFSMFHDGSLVKLEKQESNVLFQVDIQYLAEIINPNYEYFNGYLKHCRELAFVDFPGKTIFDLSNLQEAENIQPEILSAEVIENSVKVYCSIDFNYGGVFQFKAEDIKIFDQDNNQITLQQIRQFCKQYWSNLS